jgi:hypothetical protein
MSYSNVKLLLIIRKLYFYQDSFKKFNLFLNQFFTIKIEILNEIPHKFYHLIFFYYKNNFNL